MEPERFDDLTRRVRQAGSRRAACRLLVGTGLGVLGLTADPPATDASCRRDGQRCGGKTGRCCLGLACQNHRCGCFVAGAPCAANRAGCCANAQCVEGQDFTLRCTCDPGFVSGFLKRCEPCAALGHACASAATCCLAADCRDVAPAKGESSPCDVPAQGAVCCRRDGEPCQNNCHCCGQLTCQDGYCAEPCLAVGVGCTPRDRCCGPAAACGRVDPFKGRFGCDSAHGLYCCLGDGQACAEDCACCGSSLCQNGQCAPPCVPFFNTCTVGGAPCCDDVPCFEGRCRNPGSGSETRGPPQATVRQWRRS